MTRSSDSRGDLTSAQMFCFMFDCGVMRIPGNETL